MNSVNDEIFTKNIENNQFIYSNEIFHVIPCGINYQNGADICIKYIDLNYQCIGLTSPLNFNLGGKRRIFDIDCKADCISSEVINNYSDYIMFFVNGTISDAYLAIIYSQKVEGALSIDGKNQNAFNAVQAASDASYQAANTLVQYILVSLNISPNTLESALQQFAQGVSQFTLAGNIAATLSNSKSLTNADVTAPAGNSIVDYLGNAITLITNSINTILTLNPAPPQEVINYANSALITINNASNIVNQLSTANPPTWSLLSYALENVYLASDYVQKAILLMSESTSNLIVEKIINSFGYVLQSINYFLKSADSLNNSLFQTGRMQLCSLNNSACLSIYSAKYSIEAVNFPNNQTFNSLPIYNNFKTSVSNLSCCSNNCCFNQCNNDSNSLLFYQQITSFHISDLNINVCGTIGNQCFKAQLSYPYLISLQDLNFKPIILDEILCIPEDIHSFVLKEQFIPDFQIQCVYPVSRYDAVTSSFTADIYSRLNLKTILSGVRMNKLNCR